MNKLINCKLYALVLVGNGCTLSASAQEMTGVWNGQGMVDAKRAAELTYNGRNYNLDVHEAWKKMRFILTLNADGSFRLARKVEQAPRAAVAGTRVTGVKIGGYGGSVEGTYTRKGTVLTLVITKEEGVAPKVRYRPATAALSEDGRVLKLISPDLQTALGVSIDFVRRS